MDQSSTKQLLKITHYILNSKNFEIVLISNISIYFYAIRINMGIRNAALYEVDLASTKWSYTP